MARISDKQASFIERLLGDRLIQLEVADMDEARDRVSLDTLTGKDASTVIQRLLSMNPDPDPSMPALVADSERSGTGNRPGPCDGCNNMVEAGEGFYFLRATGGWGVHHKADECGAWNIVEGVEADTGIYKVEGEGTIKLYTTGTGRLGGKRLNNSGKWVYSLGAVMLVRQALSHSTAHLFTASEASDFAKQFGSCIECSQEITTDNSLAVGYGPVCAKKNGWPWTKTQQRKAS